MVSRKVLTLALAAAVIVVTSVASAFALGILPPKAPGIYLTITPAGLKKMPRGAYAVVQVSMMTPDGPMKVVYRGRLRGTTLFIPYDKVAGIASRWVKEGHVMPGMMIDYWVVSEDGELIASGTTMVNYDPAELMRSKTLSMHATVTVTKEPPPGQEESTTATVKTSSTAKKTKPAQPEDLRSFTWYEWRRVLYVAPENYTGSRYVKLPILILYNSMYSQTTLRGEMYVSTYRGIRFSAVVAMGSDIESNAKRYGASNVIPKLTIEILSNATVIFSKVGSSYMNVSPGKVGYIWVEARPVAEYQKEWRCTAGALGYTVCRLTGKERVVEYVEDLGAYPSGRLRMGAVVNYPQQISWPVKKFSEELENLLNYVDFNKVVIPGDPYLSDGRLDPGESLLLGLLFPAIQYSVEDEEMVIPVGATLAAILDVVGVPELCWLAPILSVITVTLTYESINAVYCQGGVINVGAEPVVIYDSMTKLKYGVDLASTYLPVLYLEALPS